MLIKIKEMVSSTKLTGKITVIYETLFTYYQKESTIHVCNRHYILGQAFTASDSSDVKCLKLQVLYAQANDNSQVWSTLPIGSPQPM